MYAIAAVGILGVVGILALLTWLNEKTMARTLAPHLARPKVELPNLPMSFYGGPVGAVARPTGHSGAMRRYASDVALGPVLWRDDGELLPATPVVRIPTAQPEPEAAYSETRTPQRTPALEADVFVPGAQAILTALALAICAGLLAWALGWSWRVPVVVGALTLAAGWLWRLRLVDSLLWQIESFTGRDLDQDQHVGRPQMSFALANAHAARSEVAKETRQEAVNEKHAALLAFVDRCFMLGTPEGKHGVKASGPDRTAYIAQRDALMALGIAKWRNPDKPKAGWIMAVSRQRARQLVTKHVL
jgi:hypothetical protein